jgi:hypothetical protein
MEYISPRELILDMRPELAHKAAAGLAFTVR